MILDSNRTRLALKLPPLTPPYTGGEHAAALHRGGFLRSSLPLCKGELVGVVDFSF